MKLGFLKHWVWIESMASITQSNKVSTFFLIAVVVLGFVLMFLNFKPSFFAPSLVSPSVDTSKPHEISQLEEARTLYETQVTQSIYHLITPWLGDNAASVTVRAEMDFTQNEKAEEILDIDNPALQVVQGDDITYTYSKTNLQNKRSAAVIQRLSIAVLLDNQKQNFSDETLQQIRKIIEHAAGFNEARGDTIEIVETHFMGTPFWRSAINPLLILLLLFVLGALVIKSTLTGKQIESAPAILPAFTRPEVVGQVGASAQIDGLIEPNALKKAQTLQTQKPKETLNLLRGWMCQTEGGVDES